jgi:tetraacyldisaccharide 4'-kinase
MREFIAWLWRPGKDLTTSGRAARIPFSIMAFLYGHIMAVRQRLYDTGFLKKRTLSVPVLVAGNLSAGGTGKTPLAAWLARRLFESGKKPVVISRGYAGRREGQVSVVSDRKGVQDSPENVGDEPVWLAEKLQGVPVVTGRDRYRAGILAIERFQPDCIILDDGFQHLALERDVNIVLLDAGRPIQDDDLIPRGSLREPPSALARADILVISRAEDEMAQSAQGLKEWNPDAPVFFMRYLPVSRIERLKRAVAFCGIASPGYFFKMCEGQGIQLVDKIAFPDHHRYTSKDLSRIEHKAQSMKADFLVTTQKDEIKLKALQGLSLPLEVLKVEPEFFGKDDQFFKLVCEKLFG